jgi:hypothetical protein
MRYSRGWHVIVVGNGVSSIKAFEWHWYALFAFLARDAVRLT